MSFPAGPSSQREDDEDGHSERDGANAERLPGGSNCRVQIGPDAMSVRIQASRAVPRIRFAPVSLPHGTFIDNETGEPYRAPAIYTP
jgi:hypothetical protein